MKPIQLFCLPYAGGSPDFFDGLKPYLDETITLCALEYAGHGIAMGNGTPEAKQVADYVTTDLADDGIYHALAHFGLIGSMGR